MTWRRLPPWSLLAVPSLLLAALLYLSRAPDDPWPKPGQLLSLPNLALVDALGVALDICCGAVVVYVLASALRRRRTPADLRAVTLMLLPAAALGVATGLDTLVTSENYLTISQFTAGLVFLAWPGACVLLLGYLLMGRKWRTGSVYAALAAVAVPLLTLLAGPFTVMGERVAWSYEGDLRLPGGATYHLVHATRTCVNTDVFLKQTRRTPLRLEGRVLSWEDSEDAHPKPAADLRDRLRKAAQEKPHEDRRIPLPPRPVS